MIKAAVFDIGNVLLKFNYFIAAERLKLINGLKEIPEPEPLIRAKADLETGKISQQEFLVQAMDAFEHDSGEESFLAIWRDIFHPNEPMVEFARSLSERLPLYLLSNISCIHKEHIFQEYGFFSLFGRGAYSYELGCLKPDPLIYEKALSIFKLPANEVVLFDDMLENVEAAKAAGWNALHYDFREHEKFLYSVLDLGLTFSIAPFRKEL